ncbi:MAG: SapC family protein [Gammaproteobacteria bacterium]|jgi:hypothetical protein
MAEPPLPPGYRSLVAFDRDRHAGLGVRKNSAQGFAAQLQAIPILLPEFVQAARDYPLVFVREGGGKLFAMVLVGTRSDENLFVGQDGDWAPASYVPAYVRRWPFYSTPVDNARTDGQFLVGVDESALQPSDTPFLDATGQGTPEWEARETLITEMEAGRQQTERMLARLEEHGLLEAFEAHGYPEGGQHFHLRGMYRVNEEKLNALPGRVIKQFMQQGELGRLYAHLMSLDNFRHLLDRAAAAD